MSVPCLSRRWFCPWLLLCIKPLARELNLHDTRLWRVVRHYTEQALKRRDLSQVRNVGFDETSSKGGHDYVSFFVDLDTSKVIFATEGKDSSTLRSRFKTFLEEHGGRGENIERMCCDISPAFIKGVREYFPGAKLPFDKFHVMKVVNDAVDSVRREERKEDPSLAHTRYLWLKNPQNLTEKQKAWIGDLSLRKRNRKTARAYQMKLSFQEIFKRFRLREEGELLLKKWYFWATHSRLSATGWSSPHNQASLGWSPSVVRIPYQQRHSRSEFHALSINIIK